MIEASLCLSRVRDPASVIGDVGPWIVAAIGERLDLPPVGVVADFGALLFGSTLRPGIGVPGDDPVLAAAVRRYEDAVLGRLAVDARLTSAGYAVARLPKEKHAQAVGILVAGVLERIEYDAGVELRPGIVRELTGKRPEETLQRGFAALRDDAHLRRELAHAYTALARAAQKARELLGEAHLFALENLTVLGSLTQRLAIGDVVRAQESVAESIPRRLPRRHKNEGAYATHLEDESVYPVGGFSSMSTSGSIENLVTSELIYMDSGADVDLFDMRYVEGELLYYTRDEAIFVRRRRVVILVLAPDLVRARVKDPELPWQRIVLVLAVVLVVTKKLAVLLGDEALEIKVVFETPTKLAEERALAELMLREWRDKGMAEVREASWADVGALAAESARRALVEVVRISAGGAAPKLDPPVRCVDFPLPAPDAWSRATADLLSALL